MNEREKALRDHLLATFKVEAEEHVAALSECLLRLEKLAPGDSAPALVETAFREAHSLKGAARAVNMDGIERVCQAMEGLFSAMKRGSMEHSPALVDLLLRATELLERLKQASEGDTRIPVASMVAALSEALHGELPASREVRDEPRAVPADEPSQAGRDLERGTHEMVRVSTQTLDAVRQQTEELIADKAASARMAQELRDLRASIGSWKKRWSRVHSELRAICAAQPSPRTREFLDWNKVFVDAIDHRVGSLVQAAAQGQRSLAARADGLAEDSLKLLMLPCSWLLDGLRRAVRDLARDLGKDVEFVVEGDAIEIDRRILTELKDPFLHMLRNCVDHGIETPEERRKAGKPPRGTVKVSIARGHGSRIEIRIGDDGRGIDAAKVRSSATKAGVIEEERAAVLAEQDAVNLVFLSEVSTSPLITDVSGRGLGLAIARDKVESLGGSVAVESRLGAGTILRLTLPHSLATFRGVAVRVGERFFVVPTACVERVLRVAAADIRTVENRETIHVRDETTAVARLADVLGVPRGGDEFVESKKLPALVVVAGSTRVAFLVDEIWQEQEVLVKGLGPHLQRLPGVTGATMLGNGKVAPVLDGAQLLRAAVRAAESGTSAAVASPTGKKRKSSILVAEDSITSRTLLKNILEAAGYAVETVVDGMEALAKLRSGDYDLVVSDVDMPRLDGIALTTEIRADAKLAATPVVLVTSLGSREDRERGIDVGANAYIVKRSFEQSNLLEAIQRLL